MTRSKWALLAALSCTVALAVPGQARAQGLQSVSLTGQPVVGQTVTAVVTPLLPGTAVHYRWMRCTGLTQGSCARIDGAPDAPRYVVTAADRGKRIAVTVITQLAGVSSSLWTIIVVVVTDAPAPPAGPSPSPSPSPSPAPAPGPSPEPAPTPGGDADPPAAGGVAGFDQAGGAPAAPAPGSAEAAWLRYLRPFPVVRVKGRLVARGAKVTLLRVRAPARAKVDVRCARRGCRVHKRFSGSRRIRRLERVLPAGTRITVRIWRTARIGKYVRLRIRAGAPPKRRDACLLPGSRRPRACPLA